MTLKAPFNHTIPFAFRDNKLKTFTIATAPIDCIPNVVGIDLAFDFPSVIQSWAGNAGSNPSKDRIDFPHADKISLMIEEGKPMVRTFRLGLVCVELVCVYRKGNVDTLIKVRNRSKVVYTAYVNKGVLCSRQDLITPKPKGVPSWRVPNSHIPQG